jgi:hypothetical protein
MPTYATFPGISKVVGVSFTMSTGTVPSSGTLVTVPHTDQLPFFGDLEIIDENHGTFIRLRDCVVEAANLTGSAISAQLWNLRILDRRWRWRYGQISGHYNEPLTEDEWRREKTPQELANLLFEALGETTHEVDELPDDSRPHVIWELASPADELARLCENLGCRVVLSLSDNVARIVKRGEGADLPNIGKEVSLSFAFARKAVPDNINIVTGPSRYESVWQLEAVGEETDGTIVPIDDLSYKPTWWTKSMDFPYFLNVSGDFIRDGKQIEKRTLAQKTVFRTYRVLNAVGSSPSEPNALAPPGYLDDFPDETVDSIEQLTFYPFLNTTLDERYQDTVEKKYNPAVIMAIYFPPDTGIWTNLQPTMYRDSWSLDPKGLVTFSEHLFKKTDDANFPIAPADIWLHATCEVKNKEQGVSARWSFTWPTEGSQVDTPDMIVERPELVLRTRPVYVWYSDRVEEAGVSDNKSQIETDAQRIADEKIREFDMTDAGSKTYAGIWPVDLDGALEQVSWSFSATQAAFTTVGRQMEVEIPLIGHNEKRSKQIAQNAADKQEMDRQTASRPDRNVFYDWIKRQQ